MKTAYIRPWRVLATLAIRRHNRATRRALDAATSLRKALAAAEAEADRLARSVDSLTEQRDRLRGDLADAEHEIDKLEAKIKVQDLEADGTAAAFQATLSKLEAYIAVNASEAGSAAARQDPPVGPFSVG